MQSGGTREMCIVTQYIQLQHSWDFIPWISNCEQPIKSWSQPFTASNAACLWPSTWDYSHLHWPVNMQPNRHIHFSLNRNERKNFRRSRVNWPHMCTVLWIFYRPVVSIKPNTSWYLNWQVLKTLGQWASVYTFLIFHIQWAEIITDESFYLIWEVFIDYTTGLLSLIATSVRHRSW